MQNKILIIDDDTRLRNLLGKYLADNNFEIALTGSSIQYLYNSISKRYRRGGSNFICK